MLSAGEINQVNQFPIQISSLKSLMKHLFSCDDLDLRIREDLSVHRSLQFLSTFCLCCVFLDFLLFFGIPPSLKRPPEKQTTSRGIQQASLTEAGNLMAFGFNSITPLPPRPPHKQETEGRRGSML